MGDSNAIAYCENDRFAVRLSYNHRDDSVECEVNCGSTSLQTAYRREAGYLDLSSSVDFEALGQELTVSLDTENQLGP